MTTGTWGRLLASAAVLMVTSAAAFAAQAGAPTEWQIGMQEPVTPVGEFVHWFHSYLLVIITAITLFVMALLIYVMVKFNARANPVPSRTTHNTMVEVLWTVIPVLILIAIAIPSFRLLYLQRNIPQADMTVKIIGNPGWNWTYQYPDLGLENDEPKVAFGQNLLPEDQAKAKNVPYLLATDVPAVVPVGKTVKIIVTSDPAGIIHAWTIPSFGLKIDAIPGRLNEDWFNVAREGVYYGQCSELCGQNHAYMPIEVWAVSEAYFKKWSDLMLTQPSDADLQAFLATIKPAQPLMASN